MHKYIHTHTHTSKSACASYVTGSAAPGGSVISCTEDKAPSMRSPAVVPLCAV